MGIAGTEALFPIGSELPRQSDIVVRVGRTSRGRSNGYAGFDRLVEAARPDQATLVPDAGAQLTSDHGWDLSDPAAAGQVAESPRATGLGRPDQRLHGSGARADRPRADHPERRTRLETYVRSTLPPGRRASRVHPATALRTD